jgi:hypothetical protein
MSVFTGRFIIETCPLRAAEAELVLVTLRRRTHDAKVFLSPPMSLEKEKAKELAVHACGGACDGGQERDAVIGHVCLGA